MTLDAALDQGLTALGLSLDKKQSDALLAYVRLLDKWNQVYNLTAVRSADAMLTQHVLDSLAVLPHLNGQTLLDVGSGGGLPGIPLAIAKPEVQVTLLDSNHKKATFLRQAVIELALPNVEVVCERAESWQPQRQFDVVISRAFSELSEFVAAAGRLCAPDGVLVAMKGVHPYEEIAQLPRTMRVQDVVSIRVPGLAADRHLVLLQPTTLTGPDA